MNYFFDTEFIEGKQPKKVMGITYGYTKPIIDLISIGIVSEDGREYYAINNSFNLNHAWSDKWIRENVLLPIYQETFSGDARNIFDFDKKTLRHILKIKGKHPKLIATEILMFVCDPNNEAYNSWLGSSDEYVKQLSAKENDTPAFWAYYASTDWVAFYQLWGKMIDSPSCYPMYVMDLKNLMEFKGLDKEWKRENCPDPKGEHNALVDARWNKKLFDTINAI